MIKCSFCGHKFPEEDGNTGCSGCPMSKTCGKSKCPNCGFEIPKEAKLVKFLKKKWGYKNG